MSDTQASQVQATTGPVKITLSTVKASDRPKFALSLKKATIYVVKFEWDGAGDGDLHAIVCRGQAGAAQLTDGADVLSTYNVEREISGPGGKKEITGMLRLASDKTFSICGGALLHSPDATDGVADEVDEFIKINPSQLPTLATGQVYEIPLLASVHTKAGQRQQFFRDLRNPRLIVEEMGGPVLLEIDLGAQFGDFALVQAGALVIDGTTSYDSAAVGFTGDINDALNHFAS